MSVINEILIGVKGDWIVAVKHGAGWRQYPGTVRAVSDTNAARLIRRAWGNYRKVRVRPDHDGSKWRVITFTFPKQLQPN